MAIRKQTADAPEISPSDALSMLSRTKDAKGTRKARVERVYPPSQERWLKVLRDPVNVDDAKGASFTLHVPFVASEKDENVGQYATKDGTVNGLPTVTGLTLRMNGTRTAYMTLEMAELYLDSEIYTLAQKAAVRVLQAARS